MEIVRDTALSENTSSAILLSSLSSAVVAGRVTPRARLGDGTRAAFLRSRQLHSSALLITMHSGCDSACCRSAAQGNTKVYSEYGAGRLDLSGGTVGL